MILQEKYFVEYFTKETIPVWPCPYCRDGYLIIKRDSELKEIETQRSKRKREDYTYSHPDEGEYTFLGILRCNKCYEVVSVIGDCVIEDKRASIDETFPNLEYVSLYFPKYFNPPIKIIDLDKIPNKIERSLMNTHKLIWSDKNAAANNIRSTVEEILNHFKIKKQTVKKNFIPLHKRLEEFSLNKKEVGQLLLAIKYIGNQGSHGKQIDFKDNYNALKLLNSALEKLFVKPDKELQKIAKGIIKRKGVSKKRKYS